MSQKLQILRGPKSLLPELLVGELGYCTDTNELFIGTNTGNVLVNVDLDESITNASFNSSNGELTLTKSDSSTVIVDLDGRYLQSFTETDPTVPDHVKDITETNIGNWNTAYEWGDHASEGYLTSFTETDPVFIAQKGVANGVAELDGAGLVPQNQLPSYVDDVLEYADSTGFPTTGETGKIYVAIDTGKTWRWTGTVYVEIANTLDFASQAEAEAGTNDTKAMSPARTAEAIAALSPSPNDGQLTVQGSSGLSGTGTFTADQSGDTTITLSHADTSTQANEDNSANSNFIKSMEFDAYGHVTSVTSGAEQGLANVEYYTTTIATTDWSGTDPVTAVKTVSGVLSTDKPLIDIDLSSVAFGDIETTQTEYAKLYRVSATANDEITFYALEAPTENLTIQIKVVR